MYHLLVESKLVGSMITELPNRLISDLLVLVNIMNGRTRAKTFPCGVNTRARAVLGYL